ncbi:MAG: hypothetical protein ACTSUE_27460 [Promethearchaeota archaeon]
MSSLTVGVKLIFLPSSVELDGNTPRAKKKLGIGILFGLVGFILQGIYVFPRDEISLADLAPALETLVNAVAGALLGTILFYMLYGFDALLAGILGERGYRFELQASYAPFLAMPLTCIPVHEIFGGELSLRGYYVIVFMLIIIFLAWHGSALAVNLLRKRAPGTPEWRNTIVRATILISLEIVLGVAFIVLVPTLFGSSGMEFLEVYF